MNPKGILWAVETKGDSKRPEGYNLKISAHQTNSNPEPNPAAGQSQADGGFSILSCLLVFSNHLPRLNLSSRVIISPLNLKATRYVLNTLSSSSAIWSPTYPPVTGPSFGRILDIRYLSHRYLANRKLRVHTQLQKYLVGSQPSKLHKCRSGSVFGSGGATGP